MKNKVLLIGGAGYVGLALSDFLVKKNFEIKCFDNLIYLQDRCLNQFKNLKNFIFVNGDIRNFSIKSILNDV